MLRQSSRSRPSFWAIANVVGVLAIALLSFMLFRTWAEQIVAPASLGDFGVGTDNVWRVSQIVPHGPADRAGIKVGDQVLSAEPQTMHFMIGTADYLTPRPGEVGTVVVEREGVRRTVTLRAQPSAPMKPADALSQAVLLTCTVVFVAIGAWLVLLRPTLITWSVYLLGAGMVWGVGPSVSTLPFIVLQVYAWQILVPVGLCGFLVFALRFPSGEAVGWRKGAEFATWFLGALYIAISVGDTWVEEIGRPHTGLVAWADYTYYSAIVAMCVVAAASFIDTYRKSSGLERQRISWVVLGFVCAAASTALTVGNLIVGIVPHGWIVLAESALVIFPITVAYAVVRHRVIDVRFVVSRALVVGVIGAAIVALVIAVDWLFSTRFADSPAKTAVYAGIGVAVGLSLNTARRGVAAAIDALFFKRWYAVNERVLELSELLARASTRQDAYAPLTAGIAQTFTLASCALFERLADGGFIRVASVGWPRKTLWHLLPDDPVTSRTLTARPVHVDAVEWHAHALPVGVARPSILVPIVAAKEVPAFVLCGSHDDGTAIDPDEAGAIRKVCSEAGFVFASGAQRESRVVSAGS